MNELTTLHPSSSAASGFSVGEYLAIANQPPMCDWPGKVELVEGTMTRMPPPGYPHFKVQRQIFRKLDAIFGDGIDGWLAGQDLGTELPGANVRIPDIVIFREPDPGAKLGISDRLLLAIEVAETSLQNDLGPKQVSYAAAKVPHYWVVDINAGQVHMMSDPAEDSYSTSKVVAFGQPLDLPGGYGTITIDPL